MKSLPPMFNTPLKGFPFLIIVTILNAATFWPLTFDLIDLVAGFFGVETKYASFEAMPVIFYICSVIFALMIGSIAIKLLLSIVSILAVHSANGNSDLDNPNTVTEDFNEGNRKDYTTMLNIMFVFIASFGIGLYSLNARFDHIQLNNDVKYQQSKIQSLEDRLKELAKEG